MATSIIPGQTRWSSTRDSEGYREYRIVHKVRAASIDGPAAVRLTPGLPLPGSPWVFDADADYYCWCRPDDKIDPVVTDEPNTLWTVENIFSNKPLPRDKQRCQDVEVQDPLLEPAKISGSSSKFQEEATVDVFGMPILYSSFEQIRGPQVEFDRNRGTVRIEQNVASSFQAITLPDAMLDRVNSAPMWGLPARCIKLSGRSFERRFHGACSLYYNRVLDFDINRDTFDRYLLDESSYVLYGEWNRTTGSWDLLDINGVTPDYRNPSHYILAQDLNGNPKRIVLNGRGEPANKVIVRRRERPGDYYVAIVASTGQSLVNAVYWLPQNGGDQFWDGTVSYAVGEVVVQSSIGSIDANLYICKVANTGFSPPNVTYWAALGAEIADKGQYSASTAYAIGDRVTAIIPGWNYTTPAGSVFVAKYQPANLLLLGIPVIF